MTDPTNGSQLVLVNTPAGERQLKRLSPADWVKLGNTLRASRKAQLRAELAGRIPPIDPTEARKELDAFDRRPLRARDVEEFVNTLEGQYAAILYSLQKDKPDAGEDDFNALGLQPGAWLGLTGDLLNLRVVEHPLAGTGESPASQANHPASETSTPTPAESGTT